MTEQTTGAAQVVQAIDAMRKGSATTVRALTEQSTAIEQVSKETDRLDRAVREPGESND